MGGRPLPVRLLVHPLGDIFPGDLAIAVPVEEEEGVDELVEDVVELGRLELGNLTTKKHPDRTSFISRLYYHEEEFSTDRRRMWLVTLPGA